MVQWPGPFRATSERSSHARPAIPRPGAGDFPLPGMLAQICPFCGDSFKDQRSLIEHLSDAHRGARPVLLLFGREPDRRCQLSQRLQKESIVIQNCTSARLRIDGHEPLNIPSNRVARHLASAVDSIVELELDNKFDNSAEPVRQNYHLTIRAPEKHALDDVDWAFVEHLGTAARRMAQVAKFFEDARCAGVVHEYAALAASVCGFLILLRHIFLREFRGKLRAHTGHRGSRAWAIA